METGTKRTQALAVGVNPRALPAGAVATDKTPLIFAGASGAPLAAAAAACLGVAAGRVLIERFAGGELHVELEEDVAGRDVFLVQPANEPIERNLFELLLLADACSRAGCARITAVVPYLGYSRQDRRSAKLIPVGGRVVANVLATAPISRLVVVDLHAPTMEGFFPMPVDNLTSFPALINALRGGVTSDSVVVAPDVGATRLAARIAEELRLPMAVVEKSRLSGSAVVATGISGDVRDRRPIVVDDMITTGGTVEAALRQAIHAGCRPEAIVAVAHAVFEPEAPGRLAALPIRRLLITDTVPGLASPSLKAEVVSVAPLLAEAIRRIHEARSLNDLLSRS